MTKTETIIRLLKAALAGQAKVLIDYDFSQMRHCLVPVTIGGVVMTFWMRDTLRRVSGVSFPDGLTLDCSQLTAERWLPPRDEFSDWYRSMNGFEYASVEEMIVEAARQREKLRAANEANDKSAGSWVRLVQAYDSYLDAEARIVDGFNPYYYLTADEQAQFEELLMAQSRPLAKSD
jgi:hypothetical protein